MGNTIEQINEDGILEDLNTVSSRREKEKQEIHVRMREKHPGISMFSVTLPYNGTYVLRPQDMGDVRVSSKAVEDFMTDLDEKERKTRTAVARLEADFIRRFVEFGKNV